MKSSFEKSVLKSFDGLKLEIPIPAFTMSLRDMLIDLMERQKQQEDDSDKIESVFIIDRQGSEGRFGHYLFDFLIMKVRSLVTMHKGVQSRLFIFEDLTYRFIQSRLLTAELEKYNLGQMHELFTT